MSEQVTITMKDIRENKYVFGTDVITEHKTGVSKTGSTEAASSKPESTFKARYHYRGLTISELFPFSDYRLGVNLRASLRGNNKKPAWIPDAGSTVDVYATDGGKIDVKSLPPKVQAQMLFGSLEPEIRAKAVKAFLAAL